jgi:SAM-dependent methyltransferase
VSAVSARQRCDLCGSTADGEVLFEAVDRRFGLPGRFSVVRCRCGLVRTEPQPANVSDYYPESSYYSYAPPRPPSARRRALVRRAYGLPDRDVWPLPAFAATRLVTGLPPGPPGALLDVGCGSGGALLLLEEAGWRCHGVEISHAAVAAARSAGLENVREGDLLGAGYPDAAFDAVRFWHSLEHVRSPAAELAEARRVLRPGGSLTVGVPNFASLGSRLARDRWFYLDVPRHLWHFTPAALRRLVESHGFRATRVRLVSTSTSVLGTAEYLLGREGGRLQENEALWYATLPLAAALDALGVGDAIELRAVRDLSASAPGARGRGGSAATGAQREATRTVRASG